MTLFTPSCQQRGCPFPATHTVRSGDPGQKLTWLVCAAHAHQVAGNERHAGRQPTVTTGVHL